MGAKIKITTNRIKLNNKDFTRTEAKKIKKKEVSREVICEVLYAILERGTGDEKCIG